MPSTNTSGSDRAREFVDRMVPDASMPNESTGFGGVIVVRDRGRVSLRMWGDHDVSNVGLFRLALAEVVAAHEPDVVVDLADVVSMDGSTVGALARCHALLAVHDRRITLRSPRPSSRRFLELCDLDDLIEPTPTTEAAQEGRARTPLETWVEIPRTPRPAASAPPVEAGLATVDPERSHR